MCMLSVSAAILYMCTCSRWWWWWWGGGWGHKRVFRWCIYKSQGSFLFNTVLTYPSCYLWREQPAMNSHHSHFRQLDFPLFLPLKRGHLWWEAAPTFPDTWLLFTVLILLPICNCVFRRSFHVVICLQPSDELKPSGSRLKSPCHYPVPEYILNILKAEHDKDDPPFLSIYYL